MQKRFGICLFFLVTLLFSVQGCIPTDLDAEWKDYNKRWHVAFNDVTPGRDYSISHKFLNPFVFNAGTVIKVKGDFDPLDLNDQLPGEVIWTFGHFRKGQKLFEDSFVVPLNDDGKFSPFAATLTFPITFQKNDVVKLEYTGIDIPHDTDVRLNIKFNNP